MSSIIYSSNAICEKYGKVSGRGVRKRGRWHEWCLIFLTKNLTRVENDTPWMHCSDKDCNENWYEHNRLPSHYTPRLQSSHPSLRLHPPSTDWWILHIALLQFYINIFYINGPLGKASNINFKTDTGALILVTGEEEIVFASVYECWLAL